MEAMDVCKRARNGAEEVQAGAGQDYSGYTLAKDEKVTKLQYSELSPDFFFREFVAPRRPVLLEGCLAESEGWLGSRWNNQYLRDKAGDAEVKIEYRGGAGERFGQGKERPMKFGDFLDELERKSDLFYLTTQELGVDHSGRPRLMSAPLDRLRGDFPLRPPLMGALVPQNVNVWMGYSKGEGSSSGLHHDFHDNLYVLLRGKKTFRLFSPADAHRMYVEGELVKVHPNGRINYKGKETLADGSDPLAETAARAAELVDRAAMKAERLTASPVRGRESDDGCVPGLEPGSGDERRRLAADSRKSEEEVAAAQAAVERGDSGAAERLAAAEEELERALEAVLDAECEGGGGFGDGGDSGESSDSDGGPGFFDGINDNPSEETFAASTKARGAADRHRQSDNGESVVEKPVPLCSYGGSTPGVVGDDTEAVEATDAERGDTRRTGKRKRKGSEETKATAPANFSRVDPRLPREELAERFPLFLEAESCTVEVEAGQMLFLPAGWFHEVSSVASEDGHMAFNYWFHPPDAVGGNGSVCDPSAPYKSSFWQRDWEAREEEEE